MGLFNWNIDFNFTFFSRIGYENSNLIKENLNQIKIFSNLESKFILFAFLIQIIIFILTQLLELSFEYQTRKKRWDDQKKLIIQYLYYYF